MYSKGMYRHLNIDLFTFYRAARLQNKGLLQWIKLIVSKFLKHLIYILFDICSTVFPRGRDPIYIVSYYIKLVPTSWTYSTCVHLDNLSQKKRSKWILIAYENREVLFVFSQLHYNVAAYFRINSKWLVLITHSSAWGQGRRQGVAKGLSPPPRVILGGASPPPRFFKFFSPLNHGFLDVTT